MINIYVGPAIGNVTHQHAIHGHDAQALRTQHLPRWREGGLTGAVMQISDWPSIAMVLSEIGRSEGELTYCRTRRDFDSRPAGSFGIFLSVEGYISFAGDFDALYALAEVGITAFTFSHNMQNALCTGSNERYGEGGFTHVGKATLNKLESLPLMVDLVHMSRAAFWDAIDLYPGEVFVSHSNADAVCPHPRNLTDDQIRAVAERGGVIGLNSYRGYVASDPYRATLSDLLDHAMHIYDLVGPHHLAVGADFFEGVPASLESVLTAVDPDGVHGTGTVGPDVYLRGPEGLEDAGQLGKLLAGLAERGLTTDDLALVSGGSYLDTLERARP